MFKTMLSENDCDLLVCTNGEEALNLIESQYVDFVCSSFYLPDMEGIELCRRVRHLTKHAPKPFVLLTAGDSSDDLAKALPAGVTDVFHRNDVIQLLAFIKRFPSSHTRIFGRVLYVEDEKSQRVVLKAMLEHRGLSVDAFASAEEALRHFHEHDYDLVLTDIVLEGTMSGIALANHIRRQTSAKGDIPIIALTAFDDRTRRIELFNLGVTDYILKPIEEDELFMRISYLLENRRLQAENELNRQQRHKDELAQSDSRFETLFTNTTEAVTMYELIYGADGRPVDYRILKVNPAYEKHTGLTEAQVIGKLTSEAYGAIEAPLLDIYEKVVETGQPTEFEYYFASREQHFRVHAFALQDKHFATMFEDITERKRIEEELSKSEGSLRALLSTIPDLIWMKDAEGVYLSCNQRFERLFGAPEKDIVGHTDYDFVDKELADSCREHDRIAMAKDSPSVNEEWVTFADDGHRELLETTKTPVLDAQGHFVGVLGIGHDITERKLVEDRLRESSVAFETHEAIVITDANAKIIRVNQAFQGITGYSAEDVLGKNPRILSSGRHDKAFYEAMWKQLLGAGSWTGEIWDKRKNGQIYPKWLTITAVKDIDGKITSYVAIFSDITERKEAEAEIHHLAFYDTLTKLPNRRFLLDRIQQAQSLSSRSNLYGALLFLDMDRFKTLNDTLGHDHGDRFLIEVARRMLHCVRDVDTVARIGGDEFVVLIEEIGLNAEEVSQKSAMIAEKIRAALAAPYQIGDNEHHSSSSIGICLYRGNNESVDSLFKHADMAMYQAKGSGRNAVRFFDPTMQIAVETRAALEADLRLAVPQKQLRLYYQIQLDSDLHPLGAEALIRWIHPVRGMVSPMQFIPIAEESSLILDIGHWVLETACKQLALWDKREQTSNLVLAINVSAAQFKKHDFVDMVTTMINIHQINPNLLKLELTESVVLSDVSDVVAKMHALKALGIRLSLDDFGTGYSSLSYLKQLPLDQIKIDQSFVRDITTDLSDAVMVQTIIGLAQNFRLNVIAEGVETEAQLTFLKQHGCMAYQGYLFSKPVPIEQFEALLALDSKGYI